MITKAVVDAAHAAFESESGKWHVKKHYDDLWELRGLATELGQADVVPDESFETQTFKTEAEARLALRDKIITAVLVAVDRAYMGVKADA